MTWRREAAGALTLATVVGCWRPTGQFDYVAPRLDPPATGGATILSAQFSLDASVDDAPADTLVLVFDREIDPTSLTGAAFMVVIADGSRVRAKGASLGPSSERDENRTVTLSGEFGTPGGPEPIEVVVIDRIWDEAGGPLLGVAAKVASHGTPPRLVAVHGTQLPADRTGGCAGQTIRTYWSDVVVPRAGEPASMFEVELADGRTVVPEAIDDVRANGSDTVDDNVIDLCVDASVVPRAVRVAAGALTAVAGATSAVMSASVQGTAPNPVQTATASE